MQIPCVYLPGPAPAVSVANNEWFAALLFPCFAVLKIGQICQFFKLVMPIHRVSPIWLYKHGFTSWNFSLSQTFSVFVFFWAGYIG
jgi:hypothetical protein